MERDIRILLVDDEPLVRRSMEKTLLRAGFDVTTAGDVGAGLQAFQGAMTQNAPFDLAVLDLNMPDFDGTEDANAGLHLLTEILKLDASLPTIVLTAFDEVSRAKEAVGRGARAYFVKGREAKLIELINNILEES